MRAVIVPDNAPVICCLRVRWISGGRTGELDFAIFQGPLSTGGPRRAPIEHEISPPPPRRFVVPLQSLEKKANIEHGVSIGGIGIKRALQALANGIRLHYLDWGGLGPALILIHGGLDNAHVFDDLAPAL